ncbi:MAG: hypothetical protein ACLTMD_00935, partial [Clostridium sp.]
MGIIKAAAHAVGTGLADQWLEALEPDNMGAQTVFTKGVQIRKGKGENGKGSDNMVTGLADQWLEALEPDNMGA